MLNSIALVQSKTFWATLLALVATIAQQFGFAQVFAVAVDPATINGILSLISVLGGIGAIVFRGVATAKVVSVLPPGSGAATLKALPLFAALWLAALGLGACNSPDLSALNGVTITQGQLDALRSSYDGAVLAPAAHYRQLGYCAAGAAWTAAHPCADRALVAKIRAADARAVAIFTQAQSLINSGDSSGLPLLYAAAQQILAAGQALAAQLPATP